MLCPGAFNTNCGCSGTDAECPMGDCQCEGQLRVNNDCTYARRCNGSAENGYEEFNCSDGQIVHVNLINFRISCGENDGRCPGAFHVVCALPTTTTTTTPTTSSVSDSSSTTSSTSSTTTTSSKAPTAGGKITN